MDLDLVHFSAFSVIFLLNGGNGARGKSADQEE